MSMLLSAHPARLAPRVVLPSGFLARHLGWPLLAAVLASVLLMHGGGDRWLADAIFQAEGSHWALRDHWLTGRLIHDGGRIASALAWLAMLGLYLRALRRPGQAALRRALLFVLIAVALGTGVVSVLKSMTHVDCPWDLVGYGGTRMPLGLFTPLPAGTRPGVCYPAGHASAGYAWVSLYFAALLWQPRWRWHGLAIGLAAGLLFGIGQQLRGAHFLSHDVATLAVCWLLSLALFCVFAARTPGASRSAEDA